MFIYQLAQEVSRRMKEIDVVGRSLTIKIMVRDPSAPKEAPKVCYLRRRCIQSRLIIF